MINIYGIENYKFFYVTTYKSVTCDSVCVEFGEGHLYENIFLIIILLMRLMLSLVR